MRRKTSIKQSSHMTGRLRLAVAILLCLLSFYCPNINGATLSGTPTAVYGSVNVATSRNRAPGQFVIVDAGQAAPLYVDAEKDYPTEQLVANAFAGDVEAVSGTRPRLLAKSEALHAKSLIIIGTIGHSSLIDSLIAQGRINPSAIQGKWESALTTVIDHPFPHVSSALVIAGSDRRGTAFAVFDLSRHIGVSPWNWWADVPAKHHAFLAVNPGVYLQKTPSVRYRGIFLNDEDWGLRPWAARKMDPQLHNIGPHTYAHIFELLLRLRANTLWPAMHRGTLPFNAVPQNAILADRWGIVMGSAHNEPLLRNNIMTWNSHRNGPWNFQTNSAAILKYWDEGLKIDGKFENIYTMGMRGAGDTGMQATGTLQDKAALVGKIITEQRKLLAERVSPDVANIPQVLWLYKEVLGLYRAGMKLPDDVTIGWADDNYGYIREMPDRQEQARSGGSALYYHVSYFGEPHDYLWLCSTPPALMREELSKAWDHGIQRMWILNVGDLKPAEMDIDYFLRMAWDEPATAQLSQKAFIAQWSKEQFPEKYAATVANIMNRYYQLNFARKPEFMGFNENNRPITRTAFNPMAWGDQNQQRLRSWQQLSTQAQALSRQVPESYHDSYFELVAYPVEAAAAQNEKFLWNDRSYLDAAQGNTNLVESDSKNVNTAYNRIQTLTSQYNLLAHGKWDGIMSSHPRNLHAFDLPVTAKQNDQPAVLPQTWRAPSPNAATITDAIEGFREKTEPSRLTPRTSPRSITAAPPRHGTRRRTSAGRAEQSSSAGPAQPRQQSGHRRTSRNRRRRCRTAHGWNIALQPPAKLTPDSPCISYQPSLSIRNTSSGTASSSMARRQLSIRAGRKNAAPE